MPRRSIDYEGKKFKIGDKAKIILNGSDEIGTLVSIGKKLTKTMPEFELENGQRVFGYECWWIPLDVAGRIEAEVRGE